ncbi:YciI family protein [Bordetella petrii]|uniref:YciI family protein n=1 Tax=Bordetella petrii TaxID=94624 RepID=UPI0037347BCD
MPYMLLIVEPIGQRAQRTPEAGRAAYDAMLHYAEGLRSRGLLRDAQSLKSESEGVKLQVRDGRQRLLDGPYAEAKEMIGGFFLLDCATRDEAVAIAAECPAAQWATVEVRELGPCFA